MPSPPAAKPAKTREESIRQQILDAARIAFARGGYDTPVREVVAAGDFSLSTLYRYYPSGKEHIVLDLYRALVDEVRDDMVRVDAIPDARTALEAWMDVGFEKVERYGVLASSVATGPLPKVHRGAVPVADLYRFTGRLIKRAVAQGDLAPNIDVREAVRVWFALVGPLRIRGCLRDGMTLREIRDITLGYFFRLFANQ